MNYSLLCYGAESFAHTHTTVHTQKQSVNLQTAKCSSCRKEKGNVNYDDLFNEISMATAQV